ncbi:MAG: hypothetical protein H6923_08325 [Alphaproteobacteria bacterium]|nr:hypothetical protein [Alphaproteobacteria bacterium]
MKPFIGTFVNKVDAKGRLSVPSRWRAIVAEGEFPGVVCYPSFKAGAIEGVTMARMEEIAVLIDESFDPFADGRDAFATSLLADAFELPFDGDGRILLPEALIAHAEIDDQAAFVGLGSRFQIWEPEAFARVRDELREQASAQRELVKPRRPRPSGAPEAGP